MVVICKSWEKQVLENTKDIAELKAGGSTAELAEQVSELNQEMARTLKTPIQRPTETKIVAVDTSGDQAMLGIGDGLSISGGKLTAGGGSGKYLHIMNMFFQHEYYLSSGSYATVNVVLNTPENLSFIRGDSGDINKIVAFAQALVDVGLTYYRGLAFMGSNNYSLWLRPDENPGIDRGVSNIYIENNTDGEQLYADSMSVSDTVIPL